MLKDGLPALAFMKVCQTIFHVLHLFLPNGVCQTGLCLICQAEVIFILNRSQSHQESLYIHRPHTIYTFVLVSSVTTF